MDVAARAVLFLFSALLSAIDTSAVEPPAMPEADKQAAAYADPKATYRTYIEAVRNNDPEAAKRCWVIDDDNKSGALDTVVGLWISTRRLNLIAEKKFGADGLDRVLKGWRRDDVSDRALDLTRQRLDQAEVKLAGETAELTIRWKEEDGTTNPAFEFGDSIFFRKVGGNWKIDANKMTGLDRAPDFFAPGAWGPMFRDQIAIMDEACHTLESGELRTSKELAVFLENRIEDMKKKYERK